MSSYKTLNRYHSNTFHRNQRKPEFDEDLQAAFFLGKLNKHHDREQVYSQLKRLTKGLNFYIKRFDMPNGPNKRGNKGFAFVHCSNREQAQRIISMKFVRLGNQDCEVKPYGGRIPESNCSEGRGTPDSGCVRIAAKFENPLKFQENLEIRSRMNSGIQVSESGASSYKKSSRNVSESDAGEETQKIPSELSQEQQLETSEEYNKNEIDYEQPSRPSSSHIADSELRDDWLEQNTNFVLTKIRENKIELTDFMFHCNGLFSVLMNSNPQQIKEVQDIMCGQHTIGCM